MKIDTKMAKLPGLFQRGSVYQLRVVVPLDIRAAYAGKSKLVQSLNTESLHEAKLAGTKERSKLLEEFEHKRIALSPQLLGTVTLEMSAELANRVRASVLRLDDFSREDPKIRDALKEIQELVAPSLTIPGADKTTSTTIRNSLSGLSEGEVTALAGLNKIRNQAAGIQLAQRNLQAVLPLVQEEALKLGLTFSPHAPGAREALNAALQSYRQAWQEVTQRDAGEVVNTPTVVTISKAKAKPAKLSTLISIVFAIRFVPNWRKQKSQNKLSTRSRVMKSRAARGLRSTPIDQ